MRVLTLWYDTWYGWKKREESSDTTFFGRGLFEQLGCQETHLSLEMVRDNLKDTIAAIRAGGPYDMTFVAPQHEILFWLRDVVDGPVVAWMADDTWRHCDFGKRWVHACDLIATTEEGAHADYQRAGFKSVLTNWACRPEWEEYGKGVDRLPVAAFHGLLHGKRKDKLSALQSSGSVALVQGTWAAENGDIELLSERDYHRAIASSAFSIALTESSVGGKPQMKGRLFEPQVHGTILVTEPCPRLEEYWEPGAECVVFDDPAVAQNAMSELLADLPRLELMREAAKKRALGEHTYAHRMRDIFSALDLKPGQTRISVSAKPQLPETPSVLIAIPQIEPEVILVSLASVKKSVPEDAEILLSSTRETDEWLRPYAEHIGAKWITPLEKTFSSAMNGMIEAAANERLIFVGHDVLVTSHALKGATLPDLYGYFWIPRVIDLESGTDLAGPASVVTVPYMLACRRSDAIRCGGFDETYRAGIGYEGRDFAARLALMLGKFKGDWSRIIYRLPSNPPRQDYIEASELNRRVTMEKWGGMPFGGSPTAFTVRPEIDRKGQRNYLCEADAALLDKAMRMTDSRFRNGEMATR